MAFKGLHFAGLEWKNIIASKIMWIVVVAIGVIPLLYGALYLAAFQDPYGRLNTVPVAVVNEDTGAVIDSQNRNLGTEVVNEIKESQDGLQWHFVSSADAQKGLADGRYFMTCTIPADFSQKVASAQGSDPQKAQLDVQYNWSDNMLASQVGESVWKQVRQTVSDKIDHDYWTTALSQVADSGRQLNDAHDGATTLTDGLVGASSGSNAITTNIGSLAKGASALNGGLGSLEGGLSTLDKGLDRLERGSDTFRGATSSLMDGTSQLKEGSQALVGGSSQVASGASQLDKGNEALAAGADDLVEKTASLPDQTKALDTGITQLADQIRVLPQSIGSDTATSPSQLIGGLNASLGGVGQIARGVSSLNATATEALTQIKQAPSDAQRVVLAERYLGALANNTADTSSLTQGIQALQGGLGGVKSGLSHLRDGITEQEPQMQKLTAGGHALSSAAPALSAGIDRLDKGIQSAKEGSKDLALGTKALVTGASTLNTGTSSALSGVQAFNSAAHDLAEGAHAAHSGSQALSVGAHDALSASGQLSTGALQLQEGSATLSDGLAGAVSGSTALGQGLAQGAQQVALQTQNSAGKAEMMSSPVVLNRHDFTSVKDYGTGFTPYFMALGLWVGCLVAGFLFKPLNKRLIISGGNPFMAAFANYLPMAIFALAQATVLMAVLQFGLKLQINNVPAFYAMGYLIALVFSAIVQMLIAAFGFPGRFLAIILLMLQLTSSAGTFPIQMTPGFFQAIHPYMPLSYVVLGMRQIMAGQNYAAVALSCIVLALIGIGCFIITAYVAYRRRTVRMDDLHPALLLG